MNTNLVTLFILFLFGVVLCADSNTIQLKVFEGSTKSWLAVYPINGKFATASIEVRESSSLRWVPAVLNAGNGYYQVTSLNGGGFKMPLSFRLTGTNGDRVVARDVMAAIQAGSSVDTLVQYKNSVPAPTSVPTKAASTQSPEGGPTTKAATTAPTTNPLCAVSTPQAEPVKIMVPLYVYPGAAWDQLLAVAATGVKIIAVVNPNNGPLPTGPDSAYTTYMKKFQDANIEMIGYVHTLWGARDMDTVKNEIDIWATKYSGIKGIFFDEGATEASALPFYTTAYNYVKAKSGFVHAVLNPGLQPDQGYLAVSTNIVIFENYATTLINTNFDSFVQCAPNTASKANYKYKFTAIIHTANLADMPWLINHAHSKGMGVIYVTDGLGGCCTYNTLTSYFPQEGTSVKLVNSS